MSTTTVKLIPYSRRDWAFSASVRSPSRHHQGVGGGGEDRTPTPRKGKSRRSSRVTTTETSSTRSRLCFLPEYKNRSSMSLWALDYVRKKQVSVVRYWTSIYKVSPYWLPLQVRISPSSAKRRALGKIEQNTPSITLRKVSDSLHNDQRSDSDSEEDTSSALFLSKCSINLSELYKHQLYHQLFLLLLPYSCAA